MQQKKISARSKRADKRWLAAICALLAASAGPVLAQADNYPSQPIRMIMANNPGSASDIYGRILFTRMAERMGQQIVVDNRPGAGGVIGVEMAARAAPDGYTMVTVTAAVVTIAPHVYRKIGYDSLKDLAPVSVFIKSETALCVNNSLPAKTVREFIDLAKAKPGALNMASAGIGATSHLGGLMFASAVGIEANHVPYKGGGASVLALAQGEAQWALGPFGAYIAQVKTGRVRCLATAGDKRSAVAPELPTMIESGVPGFRYFGWNGVVAPRGVARPVIETFNRRMKELLVTPEIRQAYLAQGEEPAYTTVEEFAQLIRDDYVQMGKMVKLAGIKPE
jgi:tripartite-type tricarboxylate transporter receptor subunit TctC